MNLRELHFLCARYHGEGPLSSFHPQLSRWGEVAWLRGARGLAGEALRWVKVAWFRCARRFRGEEALPCGPSRPARPASAASAVGVEPAPCSGSLVGPEAASPLLHLPSSPLQELGGPVRAALTRFFRTHDSATRFWVDTRHRRCQLSTHLHRGGWKSYGFAVRVGSGRSIGRECRSAGCRARSRPRWAGGRRTSLGLPSSRALSLLRARDGVGGASAILPPRRRYGTSPAPCALRSLALTCCREATAHP